MKHTHKINLHGNGNALTCNHAELLGCNVSIDQRTYATYTTIMGDYTTLVILILSMAMMEDDIHTTELDIADDGCHSIDIDHEYLYTIENIEPID